ncbi:MAG: hypothetical protein AAGC88_00935 [Bacteroidota bacterium]
MSDLLNRLNSPHYYKTLGGLYSSQRVEVIKVFLELDRPMDAETLWLHMVNSGRKVSLSCVRSSLNWLVNNALVFKTKSSIGLWEYHSPGSRCS